MPRTACRRAAPDPVRGRAFRLAARVAVLLALTVPRGMPFPAALTAQSLVDPLLPGGVAGVGIIPSYSTWDSRYGLDGVVPLGSDLTSTNAASLFPGVATLQQNLRSLTGSSTGFPSILGPVAARVSKDVDRLEFEARLGVFDWLTVGVTVPLVRARVPIDVAFRPDTVSGNLGLNPAAGSQDVQSLLAELAGANDAAQAAAKAACDADATSQSCSDATALAARVNAFYLETQSAYSASPFFPLQGSAAATALTGALASLNAGLSGAGLDSVAASFVFPKVLVDTAGFAGAPGSGSIRAAPLQTYNGTWQLGDVEVSAMGRLLRGEVRDSGAAEPRLSWELAAGGRVRLATGQPADPNVLFSVGSGDGQMDFEGDLYGALRVGRYLGVRSAARYGIQRSVVQLRRVAAPDQVLTPYSSLQPVLWSPGPYLYLQVSPRWYLTEGFSFTFDYDYYRKGSDSYALVGGSSSGSLDASVLDQQTEMTLSQVGFGLTYATPSATGRGRKGGLPAELDARYIRAIAGSGGQAPETRRFQIAVRVFQRIWGGS